MSKAFFKEIQERLIESIFFLHSALAMPKCSSNEISSRARARARDTSTFRESVSGRIERSSPVARDGRDFRRVYKRASGNKHLGGIVSNIAVTYIRTYGDQVFGRSSRNRKTNDYRRGGTRGEVPDGAGALMAAYRH